MINEWTGNDELLVNEGLHSTLYDKLGCHYTPEGYIFRVYAPNAKSISIVGSFNDFDQDKLVLEKITDNVWEARDCDVKEGDLYKLRITDSLGRVIDRRDPFAFQTELRPNNSSVVTKLPANKRIDKNKPNKSSCAMNIYEMHLNCFCNKSNYLAIAKEVVLYLKSMNYTHVELMPIMEYPSDQSWGYQVLGYYSITSRYGDLHDFRKMVDYFHRHGIKVILDWVPVHFANDFDGLSIFDGTNLFEYKTEIDAINEQWGTRNFDLGSKFVQSFLLSNINYYISKFGVDGFRFDAVSHMIYWHGNEKGQINDLGINFLKIINTEIKRIHPNFITIAEDSTAYHGVTSEDGLNFDFKWNLGWMHDILDFYSSDFLLRGEVFDRLTFSFIYMNNENYILPLSHDEVVHMKKTIVDKMFGNYEQKMDQIKLLYTHMFMHPGKKLNFMGNDIATFEEFNEKRLINWDMLNYPAHDCFSKYFKALSANYLNNDYLKQDVDSFYFLGEHSADNVLIYARFNETEHQIVILNNSPNYYQEYKIPVFGNYTYKLHLDSKWEEYGGFNKRSQDIIKPLVVDNESFILYSLQPLQAVILTSSYGNLDKLTLGYLKDIAKSYNIKGYYKLRKNELIEQIKKKEEQW